MMRVIGIVGLCISGALLLAACFVWFRSTRRDPQDMSAIRRDGAK